MGGQPPTKKARGGWGVRPATVKLGVFSFFKKK
jgi:hypothetical protein